MIGLPVHAVKTDVRLRTQPGAKVAEVVEQALQVLKTAQMDEVLGYCCEGSIGADGCPHVTLRGESIMPGDAKLALAQQRLRLAKLEAVAAVEPLDDVLITPLT